MKSMHVCIKAIMTNGFETLLSIDFTKHNFSVMHLDNNISEIKYQNRGSMDVMEVFTDSIERVKSME
ncbi:hypothetical protein FB550_102399 [Neobacillus bataviensis]|uniref:Uncharacterized protein n=1 Tax=Neobacillus bataviensis TaxID=220685 RepID=A0A561DSQ1_9BACI|nr:hypothetical protein [Neobacillus bataviensis]TWE06377.1 hypothetical protein FB550_102399 [Neobacillus bataviensis]